VKDRMSHERWEREDGQSTVEYGLIMTIIAGVLVIGYMAGLPQAVGAFLDGVGGMIEGVL